MACKEGQFDVVELMVNNQFNGFGINLNVQHVDGVTHFDFVRLVDTRAARAAKITLHSVDLVQFSTSRAYSSLKGPHPQRTSAVLHRSSTLTVAAALMPMHLLDGHCPFVDFAFFYTILSTINI